PWRAGCRTLGGPRRARPSHLETVQVGGAHPDGDHHRGSVDLLYPRVHEDEALRSKPADHVGGEVRHRRIVLHAPEIRREALPRAVHRAAHHCRRDAHQPDVPVRPPRHSSWILTSRSDSSCCTSSTLSPCGSVSGSSRMPLSTLSLRWGGPCG